MILHYVFYLMAVFGVYLCNVFFDTYYPFALNVIFITFSVIALPIVVIGRNGISAGFQNNREAWTTGGRKSIQIYLENRSILPISYARVKLYVHRSGRKKTRKVNLTTAIAPRSSQTVDIELRSMRCELITLKLKRVLITDYFHILEVSRKNPVISQIVVLPHLPVKDMMDEMFSQVSNSDACLYSADKPGDDPSEVFAIREYKPGDKMRNIHWKLTTKYDSFMVKENSFPVSREDTVLIDVIQMKKYNYDILFTLFYGLIQVLRADGIQVRVGYFANEYTEMVLQGEEALFNLFAEIYERGPYSEDRSVLDYYKPDMKRLRQRMFYVAPKISQTASGRLHFLSTHFELYYLSPENETEASRLVKFSE